MIKTSIIKHRWETVDNYIEDMLVAVKNDEMSISLCKSYIVQYFSDAKSYEYDDFIKMIEKRAAAAREHGWEKSH